MRDLYLAYIPSESGPFLVQAQFTLDDAPDHDFRPLLGGSGKAAVPDDPLTLGTDESEAAINASGVYELSGVVAVAIPLMLAITLLWTGFMITRRITRAFGRG